MSTSLWLTTGPSIIDSLRFEWQDRTRLTDGAPTKLSNNCTDGCLVAWFEYAVAEAVDEAALADTRVADEDHLEESLRSRRVDVSILQCELMGSNFKA